MSDELTDVEQLVSDGRILEALNLADARILISPEKPKLWADKGWVYFKMEDYTLAAESFTKALALQPRAATTLFFRAQCREKTGNLQGALDDYRASIDINPKPDAFISCGLILKHMNDRAAARIAFSEALKLEPTNRLALALLENSDNP